MSILNRKVVRKAIQASMTTALVGTNRVAQACYAFQTGEFDLPLPDNDIANLCVYVVTSDGSDRQQEGVSNLGPEQNVYMNVHSFVLYEKEGEWTEEQSEDKMDDMEAGFVEWLAENMDRRDEINPAWYECYLLGRSKIDSVFLAGIEYRHEAFALELVVANPE